MIETPKHDYQYIYFVKVEEKTKTAVFSCQNKTQNYALGIVKWDTGWRGYSFFPHAEMKFSKGCMLDVINFIDKLKEARKK